MNSPQNFCVLNLLEQQLQKNPKAIAIAAPDRLPLTYHQLYTHLTEMKVVLQVYGVGPQDRVALVLPNGPEMAVAFLTIASMATCAPSKQTECHFRAMMVGSMAGTTEVWGYKDVPPFSMKIFREEINIDQ